MGPSLFVAVLAGAALSVPSAAHCAVMCGPLAVHSRARALGPLRYFTGRLVAYGVVGSLSGSLGRALSGAEVGPWLSACASWSLSLLLAVTAYRLATGRKSSRLVPLGRRRPPSWTSRLHAALAEDPWLLGALTALLPCSALAAAAITAAAQGSALGGAATMVTFATLTGLALLGVTSLSGWAKRALSDRALSVVLALGALVMAVRPLPMLSQAHQTSCHDLSVSEGTP